MFDEDKIIEARWGNEDHTTIISLMNLDDGNPDMATEFIIEAGSVEHKALNEAGWPDQRISDLTAEWNKSQHQAVIDSLAYNAQKEFQEIEDDKEYWKSIAREKRDEAQHAIKSYEKQIAKIKEDAVAQYKEQQNLADKLETQKQRLFREILIARELVNNQDAKAVELIARYIKEYDKNPQSIADLKSALDVEGESLMELITTWLNTTD